MKDELQGKLVEILTSIQTAAGKASDFAMEQLPDIAQSYVVYGRVSSTAAFLMALVVFLAAMYAVVRVGFYGKAIDSDGLWAPHRIMAAIGGGMVAILAGAATAGTLHGMLFVWLAPKVWLLKEIAALLK